MWGTKLDNLLTCSLTACLILVIVEVQAESSVPDTNDVPKLKVRIFNDKLDNGYGITRGIFVTQSNQFSCVFPPGFRTGVDDAQKKLFLLSNDQLGNISLRIVETASGQPPEVNKDELRAQALARYPGSKIVDEFVFTAAGMSGPAFELEWWTETKTKMSMRSGFIPFAGGHLEITVFAPSSKFRTFDGPLNQLLLSLRTSPVGSKLGMQMISSKL